MLVGVSRRIRSRRRQALRFPGRVDMLGRSPLPRPSGVRQTRSGQTGRRLTSPALTPSFYRGGAIYFSFCGLGTGCRTQTSPRAEPVKAHRQFSPLGQFESVPAGCGTTKSITAKNTAKKANKMSTLRSRHTALSLTGCIYRLACSTGATSLGGLSDYQRVVTVRRMVWFAFAPARTQCRSSV